MTVLKTFQNQLALITTLLFPTLNYATALAEAIQEQRLPVTAQEKELCEGALKQAVKDLDSQNKPVNPFYLDSSVT